MIPIKPDDVGNIFGTLLGRSTEGDDPIVAAIKMRGTEEHYFLTLSELPSFDPETMEVSLGDITSDIQLDLLKREQAWLVSQNPLVKRFSQLQALAESYEENDALYLREM